MIRLLPYADADGATNMAADEALVRSAALGVGSLRFYGWTAATVSLGYFQPCAVRQTDPLLAPLPWVRRPSGGATLVHHHELTYAIALPAQGGWQTGESWLLRMHRIITAALAELRLADKITLVGAQPIKHGDVLCFQQFTCGDILCVGKKVVGSAQRKQHQALLQHGSILLSQREHTPSLPGICELAGVTLTVPQVQAAIVDAFVRATGWELRADDWSREEKAWTLELTADKYAAKAWNERR